MNIDIISYYIGNDQLYLKLVETVRDFNERYCRRHGYHYKLRILADNPVSWVDGYLYKIKYIHEYLKNGTADYVVFLDADAAVSNPNVRIEDLIDSEHEFFYTRGNGKAELFGDIPMVIDALNTTYNCYRQHALNDFAGYCEQLRKQCGFNLLSRLTKLALNPYYMNEGFFIIKRTARMVSLFEDCLNTIPVLFNHWDTFTIDGIVLGLVLQADKYRGCEKLLPDYLQGALTGSFENKYDVDRAFLMHNMRSFSDIDSKIRMVESLKNNKWWNKND